jgi:hypothetical protein
MICQLFDLFLSVLLILCGHLILVFYLNLYVSQKSETVYM